MKDEGAVTLEKLCPDCGEPMGKHGAGAWKCPAGCGEWLRNEEEAIAPKELTEVRFQPLTDGLPPMHWRTPEKPVHPIGVIVYGGGSKCKAAKKKKVHKPLITERFMLD